MRVQILKTPGQSKILDYYVNVYKDGEFVECLRYEGWSGTAVHEEVRDLKRYEYPPGEGYILVW